jgi:hypothetical protein
MEGNYVEYYNFFFLINTDCNNYNKRAYGSNGREQNMLDEKHKG